MRSQPCGNALKRLQMKRSRRYECVIVSFRAGCGGEDAELNGYDPPHKIIPRQMPYRGPKCKRIAVTSFGTRDPIPQPLINRTANDTSCIRIRIIIFIFNDTFANKQNRQKRMLFLSFLFFGSSFYRFFFAFFLSFLFSLLCKFQGHQNNEKTVLCILFCHLPLFANSLSK